MIKIIKRKTTPDPEPDANGSAKAGNRPTATATVNKWIAENRRSRLDEDKSSRKTIEDWTTEVEK